MVLSKFVVDSCREILISQSVLFSVAQLLKRLKCILVVTHSVKDVGLLVRKFIIERSWKLCNVFKCFAEMLGFDEGCDVGVVGDGVFGCKLHE